MLRVCTTSIQLIKSQWKYILIICLTHVTIIRVYIKKDLLTYVEIGIPKCLPHL